MALLKAAQTVLPRRAAWRLGRKLYCDARGEQIHGDIARNGEAFLQKCVVDATAEAAPLVAFDIGANQGEWTLSLLEQVPPDRCAAGRLRIEAFEPVPSTADMFRKAVARAEGGGCVSLHQHAMSAQAGETEIAVYADGAGTNTLHFESEGRAPERTVTVPLKRLTDACDELGIGHVHLVKCDTEGHDASVIRGAIDLLRAGRVDVFQFEYNHRWVFSRSFLKDVFELIDGTDYAFVRVDPTELTLFEAWHPELDRFFQSNYALVHERALGWAPMRRGSFDGSNVYV